MKSRLKKVVCSLLVFCLMISMLSVNVFATEAADSVESDPLPPNVSIGSIGEGPLSTVTVEDVLAGLASPEMLYQKWQSSEIQAVALSATTGANQLMADDTYYLINT